MPEPVTGKPVWQLSISELESALGSSGKSGLDPETAGRRLSEYGPNQLQEKAATSPWRLFFAQFEDFIIWVLIGAALVSGFLKEWVDALAILGIVVLNSVLGFIQEYRAEKSLAALKKLASPVARVWRGG
ncbi:MAG TPA: cation-transporting P-type ATPase, partial [bacterium]|nr:cation-transporting P-type ATPase [bacterium]